MSIVWNTHTSIQLEIQQPCSKQGNTSQLEQDTITNSWHSAAGLWCFPMLTCHFREATGVWKYTHLSAIFRRHIWKVIAQEVSNIGTETWNLKKKGFVVLIEGPAYCQLLTTQSGAAHSEWCKLYDCRVPCAKEGGFQPPIQLCIVLLTECPLPTHQYPIRDTATLL